MQMALWRHLMATTSSRIPTATLSRFRNLNGICYSMHRTFASKSTPVLKEEELNKSVSEEVLRRRLIFRCKNRGIKELDLMMGNWAMEFVETLTSEQCQELQTILNEETLDLVNIFLKREAVPEGLDNSVMRMLVEWRDKGNVTGYVYVK